MPRQLVSLSEEVARELKGYVEREFHSKRGAVSIVVEEALRRFLEERTGKRLT